MWCVNIVHNPAWWVGAYPCIRSMLSPAPLCQLCHWHENRGRLLHSALLCALMMHKPLLDQHQAAYAQAPTGMLHTYQHCNNGSHTVHKTGVSGRVTKWSAHCWLHNSTLKTHGWGTDESRNACSAAGEQASSLLLCKTPLQYTPPLLPPLQDTGGLRPPPSPLLAFLQYPPSPARPSYPLLKIARDPSSSPRPISPFPSTCSNPESRKGCERICSLFGFARVSAAVSEATGRAA